MPAYIIFIRKHTHTPAELETYAQKAPASSAGQPVTIHALYGRHELIEGAPIEGAAILEFPSFDEAKRWYDSPRLPRDIPCCRFCGRDGKGDSVVRG